jgi:peptidoglycan/xylan/chitin deacetylase (PgdA/CDA1 family)
VKLGIGVVAGSPQWEQLLRQEGVPFSHVELNDVAEACSILLVNRALDDAEQSAVEQYLRNGGAVLGYAAHLQGVCGTATRQERLDYLLADHDRIFPGIHILDLACVGEIPREANCLKTQDNTFGVFAGPLGGGYAVLLPFDPAVAIADARSANKSFHSARERLPFERVSLVAKGEMSRLLRDAMEYLHHLRGLPYAHLWYFPDGMENVFACRIDSDRGSRAQVDELYNAAREYDMRMSWFVDVKSHEEWLQHFAFLSGQEIGVHCYEHQTYDTYDDNHKNMLRALHKLSQVGVHAPGFTAPFGVWNSSLARAIDQIGFEYSSEFSYAYDSLPFFPCDREVTMNALQVPIHPICIGSLRRVGYSEAQMQEYFSSVMRLKLLRDEPLFFYHHPTHQAWDVVRDMFRFVKDQGLHNMTMLEFAQWWKRRAQANISITYENMQLTVHSAQPFNESPWLRIVMPTKQYARVALAPSLSLKRLVWSDPAVVVEPPPDIRRTREFDVRELLGDIMTTMQRKFSEGRSGT